MFIFQLFFQIHCYMLLVTMLQYVVGWLFWHRSMERGKTFPDNLWKVAAGQAYSSRVLAFWLLWLPLQCGIIYIKTEKQNPFFPGPSINLRHLPTGNEKVRKSQLSLLAKSRNFWWLSLSGEPYHFQSAKHRICCRSKCKNQGGTHNLCKSSSSFAPT